MRKRNKHPPFGGAVYNKRETAPAYGGGNPRQPAYSVYLGVKQDLERETGLEPATTCLEGRNSTN